MSESGAPRLRAAPVIRTALVALLSASCASPLLPSGEIGVATPLVPSPAPPSPAPPSPAPPSSTAPGPSDGEAFLAYDEALLAVLPAELDGLPVTSAPEAAADLQADRDLATAGERIALGLVVDPAGELAVAAVIALRTGVFTEAFWRDWRDSYDAGACAQAGGVRGRAEAQIGGRLVYIGTCEGGARTYHVQLEDRNILVSVTAIGEVRRLGERLVEAIGR